MAKFKRGDLFNHLDEFDIVFITTNAKVTNGKLAMGAGIAKTASDTFPELPELFGKQIKFILDKKSNDTYGIAFVNDVNKQRHKIAAFQTKGTNPYDISDIRLIRYATECLIDYAMNRPDLRIALNYPGIGLGQLNKSDVEPIVKMLPDNVTIWEL